MGYVGETLASLADPLADGIDRMAARATREVGDDLRRRVRRHTPIAKPGAAEIMASYGSSSAWIRARGGRTPGTLWESWRVGEVQVLLGGRVRSVEVYTLDPVAPHVEWDTIPHIIAVKRARALTIPTRGGMVYAKVVNHPGTRGVHMMATALLEVAASWERTVASEWAREARRIWTGGVR